ncbi:MAG: hypothetical protein NC548_31270 [Lachnospiraceae bacterium]|nr:hypothetical protein [Lachnospiraceae bacterium]
MWRNRRIVKYFTYPRSDGWVDCPYPHQTEKEINKYANENNLEIISISCDRDIGVFVAFKKKE